MSDLSGGAPAIHALLQSRRHPGARVGPDRMALLAAIRVHGSISAAAKAVGLSYKGAWDSVQALNNLFEQPLVLSQTGGRQGGAAEVTPAGLAVLTAFASVEAGLAEMAERLDQALGAANVPPGSLTWSFGMKTTARNVLRGRIEAVTDGAVNGEVILRVSPQIAIVAIVTSESIASLGLVVGREAVALVKASSVILAQGEGLRTSARNALPGVIIRHETGAVNDEVVVELAPGKTLAATVTRHSAETMGLAPGVKVTALIKASHVILAVE